jgi:hypothetical protein
MDTPSSPRLEAPGDAVELCGFESSAGPDATSPSAETPHQVRKKFAAVDDVVLLRVVNAFRPWRAPAGTSKGIMKVFDDIALHCAKNKNFGVLVCNGVSSHEIERAGTVDTRLRLTHAKTMSLAQHAHNLDEAPFVPPGSRPCSTQNLDGLVVGQLRPDEHHFGELRALSEMELSTSDRWPIAQT